MQPPDGRHGTWAWPHDRNGVNVRRPCARPYAAAAMTTLFLVRHGLTAHTGRTLYGQTPGIDLDERGLAQTEQLARRLAPVRPTAIYSSPLERCVQTVEPLAAACRLPVVETEV